MSDSKNGHESSFDILFAQSRRLPEPEQKRFIERECRDERQRKQLMDLLASFREVSAEGFCNSLLPNDVLVHAFEDAVQSSSPSESDEVVADADFQCGDRIGPYKILECIGEGGMGAVYMAEQTTPVARRVALKIVKPDMLSKGALDRFEVERQALSLMDHPHIAKVLDAGSTDRGQPYFVMELIKGIPITTYCDRKRLDTKKRLSLFVSICQAVGHAHQKGVIHRDIKPSNVLVAEYDDEAVPKIIDFGVAKATTQKLTDGTAFTRFGQLVGTFEYMSPEQAKLNQLDVDTRSDVYSLGVLLYELLTGATPFDRERLRSAAINEMIRIICEEDPPKPSTRVTTSITAEAAEMRCVGRKSLSKMFRGELDWIVMRALEKERKDRYQSPGSFADDLRRYLAGEAVEACPPTFVYRARKFARKYKTQAVATAAVFISLCVATLLGWSLFKATKRGYDEAIANLQTQERVTSLIERSRASSDQPLKSVRFAIDAAEESLRHNGTVPAAARQALWESVSRMDGELVAMHDFRVSSVSISQDEGWILTSAGEPEGPLLQRLDASARHHKIRIPHTRARRAILSPDQRWIATACDNKVVVWKFDALDTGSNRNRFFELNIDNAYGLNNALAFTGDSRWLVAAYEGGWVRAFDLTDPYPATTTRNLKGHDHGEHLRLQVNDDGSRVVTGDIAAGRVQVWNFLEKGDQPVFRCQHDRLAALSLSKQGRWLVTKGRSTRVWDLDADDPATSSFLIRYPQSVSSVRVTDDEERLVVGGKDGACYLYDLTRSNPTQSFLKLVGHTSQINAQTSRDHRWLTTSDWDGALRLWDLHHVPSNLLKEMQPDGSEGKVWGAAFHPTGVRELVGHGDRLLTLFDSKFVYSYGWDGMVRRWNLDDKIPSTYEIKDGQGTQKIAVSPDGKWLVVGKTGPHSQVWRLRANQGVSEGFNLEGAEDGLGTLAITPDSRWLIGSSATRPYLAQASYERNEKVAHVWDLTSDTPGKVAFRLKGHTGAVTAVAVSGSGDYVVTASTDMTVRVWELSGDGATQTQLLKGPDRRLHTVATNHDGSVIACGGKRGLVFLWTSKDGVVSSRELVRGIHDNYALQVAVSPNGRWVASAGGCGESLVWDLNAAPGFDCRVVPGHELNVIKTRMQFSPDGRWLATGAWDRWTHVFDMRNRDPFAQPAYSVENSGMIMDLTFSNNSRHMIVGGGSSSVVVDLGADSDRDRTCQLPSGESSVALTPNGNRAITGGSEIRIIDLQINDLLRAAKQRVRPIQ